MTTVRDDPDETEGRRLYRERAEALARSQLAMAGRRFKLKRDADGEQSPTDSTASPGTSNP